MPPRARTDAAQRPPPKQRRSTRRRASRQPAEVRRDQLVQAALKVFARAGYRSTGTLDIAREAGVGEPTIYRYFADKKELYLEVLRRSSDLILAGWTQVAAQESDPLRALTAIGNWYYRSVTEEPDPLWVRARAHAESQDDEIRSVVREGYTQCFQFVRKLLLAAREQGLLSAEVDIDAVAWLFMGVGQTIDMATLLEMPDHINPATLQSMGRLFQRAMDYRGDTTRRVK
jgi:AcrR family transcriptional regulator